MVVEFSEDLRESYNCMRNKPKEEDWPPYQPTSIVNVTVIHYKNKQTRQELIEVSEHLKTGASGIGKLISSPPVHSKVTKDISEIFKLDSADQTEEDTEGKPPNLILIEGAPGIGKTVLAKEIAYLWANHKLLTDCKLVILVYLRDPRVHTMRSAEELLQLYTTTNEEAIKVNNYLKKTKGQNVAFVFDGFDEFPHLQEGLIVQDIIGNDYRRKFCKSIVVVTSRPTCTLRLHRIVDRRIEILGFAPEERDKLISRTFSKFPDRRVEIEKYLKEHPLINSLCYIPLNLAIVLYLFHQSNLPETLTEMNEFFVFHTVYRHTEKTGLSLLDSIKCLNEMPRNIIQSLHKLSKLAFEGLQKDQLVFTYKDLKDFCPEVHEVPEAANGYSLLQAIKHYPHKGGVGKTISFNFLHLTMQEYLAAFYVSSLPVEQQLELLQRTFWDDHFNFMWIMYVGIVGAKSGAFASFVRMIKKEQIKMLGIHDKMKYLHLFQCYMEAKINTDMPPIISYIFSNGIIDLSGITLLSHHISSLLSFMSASSVQHWKSLELKSCNLHQTEMYNLVQHTINNKEKMSTLKYVDLSSNNSSSWGVYCAIIRYCSITSLSLGGDEGMKDYIEEIMDNLQASTSLHSLTLFSVGKIGVESIKIILMNNFTLKNLNLSWAWQSNTKEYNTLFVANIDNAVNVSILYDDDDDDDYDDDDYDYDDDDYDDYDYDYDYDDDEYECNDDVSESLSSSSDIVYSKKYKPKPVINLSGKSIDDNAAHVLAFGLCNNTTVEELNISRNEITDEGAVAIIDCLKYNKTLKKLDLSHNRINSKVMSKMLENIENQGTTLTLEYVDLSKNSSSPWGVYCAIIGHCRVNSLTLCGDVGLQEYIKELTDSLQANRTLKSLTLFSIGKNGVDSIKTVLMNTYTLENLNLSWEKFSKRTENKTLIHTIFLPSTDDAMQLTTTVTNSNRSVNVNILYDDEENNFIDIGSLSQNHKSNAIIKLSGKNIDDDAIHVLAFGLCNNTTVEELNISETLIDEGAVAIIDCLKHNKTLKRLDLSQNEIKVNALNKIIENINNQGTTLSLKYVDLSENGSPPCYSGGSSPWGVYCSIIRHCCGNSLTLCGDEGMKEYIKEITDSLQANTTLYSLSLYSIGKIGVESIKKVLMNNFTLTILNLSWKKINDSKGMESNILMQTIFSPSTDDQATVNNSNRIVIVNILYDDDVNYSQSLSSSTGIDYTRKYESTNVIDLSNKTINDDAVYVLALGLYNNETVEELIISCNNITYGGAAIIECVNHSKALKKLDLSNNKITDNGMNKVIEKVKNWKTMLSLEYVDLSENGSSPWGVYCVIIRYCCVDSLTLCGDEGMEEYIKEITDSLQANTTLLSLSLCSIGKIGVDSIKTILMNNFTLKRVNLSWEKISDGRGIENKILMHTIFLPSTGDIFQRKVTVNENKRGVYVNILFNESFFSSSDIQLTTCNLSGNKINDDVAHILAFGLCNNTTVVEFNASNSGITDEGAVAIIDSLKYNKTLKKLDLSHNGISTDGMNKLSENIESRTILSLVNFSGNDSSPWGVYCAIIRHYCGNSLTLCGDEGMEEYIKKITVSLQANTALQSLSLYGIGKIGVNSIKTVLMNIITLKRLNLSWKETSDCSSIEKKILMHTIFSPNNYNFKQTKTTVSDTNSVVDVSILYDGYVSHRSTVIDLSGKKINDNAVHVLAFGLCNNTTVVEFNASNSGITDEGAIAIIDSLKYNETLKKLDLSHNRISIYGMKKSLETIKNKGTTLLLEQFDLSRNSSSPWGMYCAIIKHSNVSSLTLRGDEGMKEYIKEMVYSLQVNTTLQSLTLCDFFDMGHLKLLQNALNFFLSQTKVARVINRDTIVIKSNTFCDVCLPTTIELSNITISDDDLLHFMKGNNAKIGKLIISHNNITDNGIAVICEFLKYNETLKEIDLSHNGISIDGMNKMLLNIKNQGTKLSLEYVDLSKNQASPWGVYCAIIGHCYNSLTLCGDEGMQEYIKEIIHNLQANITLQSLTLHSIGKIGVESIKTVLMKNCTLKRLNLSWKKGIENTSIIHTSTFISPNTDDVVQTNRIVNVSILYDSFVSYRCNSQTINLSSEKINDDAAHVLAFGFDNTTVEELNISENEITDEGAMAIINCLKHNRTLKKLDVSQNRIDTNEMSKILKNVDNQWVTLSLDYVDLSENNSSPWGVYCTIIRHCRVNSLTLCGDKGMKEYIKELTDSLQANRTLQSLTFCSIGKIGVESIKAVLFNNFTLKRLNLSWEKIYSKSEENILMHTLFSANTDDTMQTKATVNDTNRFVNVSILYDDKNNFIHIGSLSQNHKSKAIINLSGKNINDDGAHVLAFGLCNNTTVEELNISCNYITIEGAVAIINCVKQNRTLKKLDLSINHIGKWNEMLQSIEKEKTTLCLEYMDLSKNSSSPWGVYCAIIRHCRVNSLTLCGDEGMKEYIKELTDSLQSNRTLQSLTLCSIGQIGVESIKAVLFNNFTLKRLNLSWIKIYSKSEKNILMHTLYCANNTDDTMQTKTTTADTNRVVDVNILYDIKHSQFYSCIDCTQNYISKTVNLSGKNINDDGAHVLAFGLCNNTTVEELNISHNYISELGAIAIIDCLNQNETLKKLDVSQNYIDCNGINKLFKNINNQGATFSLNYVDVTKNYIWDVSKKIEVSSSPWGVYCVIIRHCCINSLTLCGDEGMEEYIKELTDSLQSNRTLQSLTLCSIGKIGIESIKAVLFNNFTLRRLNLSWEKIYSESEENVLMHTLFSANIDDTIQTKATVNDTNRVVNVSILYGGYISHRSTVINLSGKNINDDGAHVLAFGLCNNTTIEELNISCNYITTKGTVAIIDCVKQNRTLKRLDLSNNFCTWNYEIVRSIEKEKTTLCLEYMDLSQNGSSPWDVYCAIIRHCCVNSLTLCGDKGMEEYIKELTDSLQSNRTLQSLTLCSIGKIGVESIKAVLFNNFTLKRLNLSWKKIYTKSEENVYVLMHTLFSANTDDTIQTEATVNDTNRVVNVSILYDGYVSDRSTVIDLCNKNIDDDAAHVLAFGLCNNTTVEELNISLNKISNEGAITIFDCLKYNKTLKKLDLSQNILYSYRMLNLQKDIEEKRITLSLEYVDLRRNIFSSLWGVYCAIIRHSNVNSLTLCGDEGMEEYINEILDSLQINVTLQSLRLCDIGKYKLQLFKSAVNSLNKSLTRSKRENCGKFRYFSLGVNLIVAKVL